MGFLRHFVKQKHPSMKYSIPIELNVCTGLFNGPARPVQENQGSFLIEISKFWHTSQTVASVHNVATSPRNLLPIDHTIVATVAPPLSTVEPTGWQPSTRTPHSSTGKPLGLPMSPAPAIDSQASVKH